MGRLRAKTDYESLRNARVAENKARMASLGFNHGAEEAPPATMVSSAKSANRIKKPKLNPSTPVRRSGRLKGLVSCDSSPQAPTDPLGEVSDPGLETSDCAKEPKLSLATPDRRSSRLKGVSCESSDDSSPQVSSVEVEEQVEPSPAAVCDYESLRNARILENKARLASLALNRKVEELRLCVSSAKPVKRAYQKRRPDSSTPRRRSERLKGKPVDSGSPASIDAYFEKEYESEPAKRRLFVDRCGSKARGSVYDPVYGICCHFCRQKKLCGEEDCRRCGDRDLNQPCTGKTECRMCHSSNGVMCRACLKVRYGEEMEEVRKNKHWMCPHCIEEKGTRPYWICNSSLCLKRRKMAPTGIAIFRAREEGFESVAHLMMDKLKRQAG